jgi:predicted DNA-binding transcriptional regulator AlpA
MTAHITILRAETSTRNIGEPRNHTAHTRSRKLYFCRLADGRHRWHTQAQLTAARKRGATITTATDDRPILDLRTAADYLGLSRNTIQTHRQRGNFPDPAGHAGQSPYWHHEQLDQWHATRPGKPGRPPSHTQ